MESRRKAAMTIGASSRTETSVPSEKEMRVDPEATCRTWVTASTLMYVEELIGAQVQHDPFRHVSQSINRLRTARHAKDTKRRVLMQIGQDRRLGDACDSVERASMTAPSKYAVEQTQDQGYSRLGFPTIHRTLIAATEGTSHHQIGRAGRADQRRL